MENPDNRTIAALSSAPGTAGVALIRTSGSKSLEIAKACFVPRGTKSDPAEHPRKMCLGDLVDESGEILDQVLAVYFPSPHSYSGEDMVEYACHGGMYVVSRILERLMKAGARMALPGEFSERAFLNGKMDLNEAEGVMDVIGAKTERALQAANLQRKGGLSRRIDGLSSRLLDLLTEIEVNIDYPEYEVPDVTEERVLSEAAAIQSEIEKLLSTADLGRILREGLRLALCGLPNTGKSSLFNALLQKDRAIVTTIPGTTRDILEESADIGGLPVVLMDTAGIRSSEDIVEEMGVQRAREALVSADAALVLLDGTRAVLEEEKELISFVQEKPHLIVINKVDSPEAKRHAEGILAELRTLGEEEPLLVSALEGEGLEALGQRLQKLFYQGEVDFSNEAMITNLRQKEALIRAGEDLRRVLLAKGLPMDALAIDLHLAREHLLEVNGTSSREDVIAQIFRRFCLGK